MASYLNLFNLKILNNFLHDSVTILGNGPSLSNIKFENISDSLVIGCNWIFLHKKINLIDSRLVICFSDPFFLTADIDLWLNPLEKLKCKLLIPSFWMRDLDYFFSVRSSFNGRLITYDLKQQKESATIPNEAFNILNYPNTKNTSSVMTTACLPYAKSIARKQLNIFGVDQTYYLNSSKIFEPYFFKFDSKYGYNHTKQSADRWSEEFKQGFSNQISMLKELGYIINIFSFS